MVAFQGALDTLAFITCMKKKFLGCQFHMRMHFST